MKDKKVVNPDAKPDASQHMWEKEGTASEQVKWYRWQGHMMKSESNKKRMTHSMLRRDFVFLRFL